MRERLIRDYGEGGKAEEERSWSEVWGSRPVKRVEELLYSRLTLLTYNDLDQVEHGGDGIVNVRVPCGHTLHIRKVELSAMTPEDCNAFACSVPRCRARVLQPSDDLEIGLSRKYTRQEEYSVLQGSWSDLDQDVGEDDGGQDFHAMSIPHALEPTLDSLKPPEVVCPKLISPASFPETKLILKSFKQLFHNLGHTYTLTPRQLLESLCLEAMATRVPHMDERTIAETDLSSQWMEFLGQWLRRVVTFLVHRRCVGTSRPECAGMRGHGNVLQYHSSEWDDAEAMEAPEATSTVEYVQTALKGMNIGN